MRAIKINFRQSQIRRLSPALKVTRSVIGKMSGAVADEFRGNGALGSTVIRSDEPREERPRQSQGMPAIQFDYQVMRHLTHRERRAYAKLKERKKQKNVPGRYRETRCGITSQRSGYFTGRPITATALGRKDTGGQKTERRTDGSSQKQADVGGMIPQRADTAYGNPVTGTASVRGGNCADNNSAAMMAGQPSVPAVSGSVSGGTATGMSGSAGYFGGGAAGSMAGGTATSAVGSAGSAVGAGATAAAGAATGGVAVAGAVVVKGAKKAAESFRATLAAQSVAADKADEIRAASAQARPARDDGGAKGEVASIGSFMSWLGQAVAALFMTMLSTLISVLLLPLMLVAALIAAVLFLFIAIFSTNTTTGGDAIVTVALTEAESWEENIGGQKYKNWYGYSADWCAMFVSWCANECGYIDTGIIPRSASVATYTSYYDSIGAFRRRGDYEPKAGDLIIYGAAGSSHMGIVIDYDSSTKVITTVEGNTGSSDTDPYHAGSRVSKKNVSIGYSWIYGFCLPAYPADVEMSGGTHCAQAYNYFVSLGYTKEAAAGIVGNLMQESGLTADGDLAINVTGYDGAVGICMWTYPPIRQSFLDFASARGEPWPNTGLKVQLDFLQMNMYQTGIWMWTSYAAGYYPASANISLAQFKSCTDLVQATTAFCAMYEKPNGDLAMLDRRIRFARQVYDACAR